MANKGVKTEKPPIPEGKVIALERLAKAKGGDTEKAFLLMRYTAAHPSVIGPYDYEKKKMTDRNLHEGMDERGRAVIIWDRPKKEGVAAKTIILKHPAIKFDVKAFADEVRGRKSKYKRSRQYFWWLISELGDKAGAIISPLSFRHTLAVEMVRGGVRQSIICDTLNVSPSTVRRYVKLQSWDRNDELERIWGL